MKKLFVGLVSVCCSFSALIANDQQVRVYKMDSFDQTSPSLLFEPMVQASGTKTITEEPTRMVPSVSTWKIKVTAPSQIFLNETAPFTPVVKKLSKEELLQLKRLKVGRRLELMWHITSPIQFRQFNQFNANRLLTGGAFIYE